MTLATATSLCQGTEEARGRGRLPPKNGNITRFAHDFGEFDYVYKANTNLLDQSLSQNVLSENTASNGFSKYGYDQFNNRSVATAYKSEADLLAGGNNWVNKNNFTFNAYGQLTEFQKQDNSEGTTVTHNYRYSFDEIGAKILAEKQVDGSYSKQKEYVYEGAHVVADKKPGENWTYYVMWANERIAEVRINESNEPEVFYYHNNHLGTINQITNENEEVVAKYTFDAYGNLEDYSGSFQTNYFYTGKEWASEMGMYYFGARYYDPHTLQWISPDPMDEFWSPYSYVGGNPLSLIDVFGLESSVGDWDGDHSKLHFLGMDNIANANVAPSETDKLDLRQGLKNLDRNGTKLIEALKAQFKDNPVFKTPDPVSTPAKVDVASSGGTNVSIPVVAAVIPPTPEVNGVKGAPDAFGMAIGAGIGSFSSFAEDVVQNGVDDAVEGAALAKGKVNAARASNRAGNAWQNLSELKRGAKDAAQKVGPAKSFLKNFKFASKWGGVAVSAAFGVVAIIQKPTFRNALKTTLVTGASWGAGAFVGAIPTIASLGLGAPGGVVLGVLSGIAAGAFVDSAFEWAWKED